MERYVRPKRQIPSSNLLVERPMIVCIRVACTSVVAGYRGLSQAVAGYRRLSQATVGYRRLS